jgi:hypothetical protein
MSQSTTSPTAQLFEEQDLKKAEEILIREGRSLSHDEIRALLQSEGVSEPVVQHVVSRVQQILKKVKSGTVLPWEK